MLLLLFDRHLPGLAGFGLVGRRRARQVQKAQGDPAAALKSYQDNLAIAERLAKSDPGNALWQNDLWVSFTKVNADYFKK